MDTFRSHLFVLLTLFFIHATAWAGEYGTPAQLPLPGSIPLVDYERVLYPWVADRVYAEKLGWQHDKEVRDTGPFIEEQYHGTHPAVLMYYSPEVMEWMLKRENGEVAEIPDGAIIIKEMYAPPAATYQELKVIRDREIKAGKKVEDYDTLLPKLIESWTVMIKNSKASSDGWFWASVSPRKSLAIEKQLDTRENNNKKDAFSYNNGIRNSGFGMPCLRCHASAKDELTFAALENIEGFKPGTDPLRFVTDGTWRTKSHFAGYPLNQLIDKEGNLPPGFDIPIQQQPWGTQLHIKNSTREVSHSEHDKDADISTKDGTGKKKAKKPYLNQTFVDSFSTRKISLPKPSSVLKFPQQWLDHVVQKTGEPQTFVTSDNCLGCHGGLSATFGLSMFIATGPNYGDGYDVSEYGEWRWSPMGLAGRDPIFHAQLESEMAILEKDAKRPKQSGLKGSLKENKDAVTNTCLSCHGAMGQRQLAIDAKTDAKLDSNMKVDYFYFSEQLEKSEKQSKREQKYHQYGELAREGISCMICHRIDQADDDAVINWTKKIDVQWQDKDWVNKLTPDDLAYLLFNNSTGRFEMTDNDKINGPFEVIKKPMEHVLNITPEHNAFTSDSQMCGTCHTINLPNIGSSDHHLPVLKAAETNPAFKDYEHSIEQATFLEWQNSKYAGGKSFRSCQDCHMKGNFETYDGDILIDQLESQIASIQDRYYPQADHDLSAADTDVPVRTDYKRHTHVGLNGFLLEMFKQFNPILGVAKSSYMTGASEKGVDLAIESMKLQARDHTVAMSVDSAKFEGDTLVAKVTAKNKVGHRYPSGVAFRRGFIEFVVKDGDEVIWGSGRTNDAGIIVDNDNKPLVTEFLPDGGCGLNNQPAGCYQPHHQVITDDQQVQIYEELNQDKNHDFTTSFVHRVHMIKDNRLLPDGWQAADTFKPQGEIMYQFMEATDPRNVGNDPDYAPAGPGFVGKDSVEYRVKLPQQYQGKPLTVEATMYFQAIPPYWLQQRFALAPKKPATRRLFYIASHLDLEGTIMDQWKFKITTAKKTVE